MIVKFFKYSLKNKIFLLIHIFHVLKTQIIYGLRFKSIGGWSSFNKKLFMTYRVISLGKRVTIGPHARIEGIYHWNKNKYNPHIIIEDGVTIQQRCHIVAASELIIGKNSMLAFDVMITDTDHGYSVIGIPISEQDLVYSKTRIGERCFIGAGAKILAGTILGEQCVVGSNAVVRGKFPAFCVIAGSPARVLKRYDEKSESWRRTDEVGRFL